jgi:hypothetical protein
VAERWLLLVGAEAVGFFPLLVPFLPGVQGGFSAEFRAGTALALCFTVAAVLAVTLGASVLAGELAEGRLAFYFARPIAGWAVWAGKLAGAAVLSIGAALLVLLPTLVVDERIELGMPWWMDSARIRHVPAFVGVLAAGCILLLLLSHLVSSMVRSRSPWLLLDLGAALTAAGLFWGIRQTLWREGAFGAFYWGLGGFILLLAAAAAAASAVQVTRGRTDARRAHRLLSLTFWSGLGIAIAGFAAYSRWVLAVSPGDLWSFEAVLSPPAGTWIGLRGPAVHRGLYFPAFLFDTASGRSLKIGASPMDRFWWLQPVFSPDGRRAAWLEAGSSGYELKMLDLARPGARPAATAVAFEEWPDRMALSPGGRLLAAVHGTVLTVDDLEARRLVASVPLTVAGGEQRVQMRFLDEQHLRVYQVESERVERSARQEKPERLWRLTALDLEPGHGRLLRSGSIEVPGDWMFWTVGPDGWHVALRTMNAPLRLGDLRTGTVLATLPLNAEGGTATFLADGRLLLDQRTAEGSTLRVLDREGAELRQIAFPALRAAVGGEVQPGRLVMATTRRGSFGDPAGWSAFVLNLDNGQTTPVGPDLLPVVRDVSLFDRGTVRPEAIGSRLFLGKGGSLVLFDPATGHLRTLLRLHGG